MKSENAGKKRSGCGCDMGARPAAAGAGVALGLLGALLLAARRRRRA